MMFQKTWKTKTLFLLASFLLLACSSKLLAPHILADTQTNTLYDDALSPSWNNWSWGASVDFNQTNQVKTGTKAIAFTPNAWGAFYLHTDTAIDLTVFQTLHFSLYATGTTPKLTLLFYDNQNQKVTKTFALSDFGGDPEPNSWKTYDVPLTAITSLTHTIKGIALQESTGAMQSILFIDDLSLVGTTNSLPVPITQTPTPPTQPLTTLTFYNGTLSQGWNNWSWNSSVDLNATSQLFTNTRAIAFTPNAWGGLYLHTENAVDTTPYQTLSFALHKSTGKFGVFFFDTNNQPLKTAISLTSYETQPGKNGWTTYTVPLVDAGASNTKIKGFVLQEISGYQTPTVFVDAITLNTTSPLSPSGIPSPTMPQLPINTTGYTAKSGTIYKNDTPILLKGVSWFGFETGTHVVHGLWQRNWKDMITQIKTLGFTAVRIPFCPATLQGVTPTSIDFGKNPDLQNLSSLQVMDKIMQGLNDQGLYILLDHHTPDCNTITDLWYTSSYSETQWITDVQMLAKRYQSLPNFIGIDLKNEPHGKATWGTGNKSTDWNTAAENAGKAVLTANPNLLIFVQGIQDNPTCSGTIGHWQGGNLEPENCTPIAESMIPANKLVLSPHVYGPDVYKQSYFSDANFPANMPAIWFTHFGYLTAKGMTIVPGEWGGKYGTSGGDPKDAVLQNALTSYFSKNHICNAFYWSLNPNSGDTGGILQDDWSTPWPQKMALLSTYTSTCALQ